MVIDGHIPFVKGILEPFARVIYSERGAIGRELARQADGLIIRTRTRCDATLLEGSPVRFIATATIGHDHIDTAYCEARGIRWHDAPGCNANAVNQYMASALATLCFRQRYILKNKRIGIIGVGNIGAKIASLARILGMVPLLNDPPRERKEGPAGFVNLEEILETTDIISLHVPLNPEGADKTFHLAGEAFFSRLQKKPLLINTARGPVADTAAVKKAIRTGRISGYIADVWENEPALDLELLEMSNIATPHIAGYSVEGKANGTAACVRAASRHFGFGIDNWYPENLPQPAIPLIKLETGAKSSEQLISEAILATYDIMKDDAALRANPGAFEALRDHYPARREFGAYSVMVDGGAVTTFQNFSTLYQPPFNSPLLLNGKN
ncbi:MAG: 4-phosphoerythronate dehydrogenase [Bacteroidales bacterium]|nr:4-phosphoerythronate dehydrogenase [Bacteroidales bacterium]